MSAAVPPLPPTRHEVALGALVTLWDTLEGMDEDEAATFLTGPGAAFLVGLDVAGVLAALRRDRARRGRTVQRVAQFEGRRSGDRRTVQVGHSEHVIAGR